MASYDSILRDLCRDEVYRELFGEPSSSPHELGGAEQAPVSAAASSSVGVLKEATVDSLLLAALEQFKDEAMDRLLLSALEEYEESRTTQKAKKTPARRFATPKCDEDVAKAKIVSVPKENSDRHQVLPSDLGRMEGQ